MVWDNENNVHFMAQKFMAMSTVLFSWGNLYYAMIINLDNPVALAYQLMNNTDK